MASVVNSTATKKVSAMDKLIKAIEFEIARRELSMTAAAEMAGISRMYLYKILNRKAVPTMEVAEQIMDAFGFKFEIIQR